MDEAAPRACPDCGTDLVEDRGRRQVRVGGLQRKQDAQDEMTRIIADHHEGRDPLPDDLSVSDWLDRWLDIVADSVQVGDLAPKTAAGYESHVRIHLKPRLGHIELRDLTPGQVADFMRALQATGKAAATAVRVRATLSRALSDAMRHELVPRNVAQIAKPPKVEKHEPSAFTRAEFRRIMKVLDGHRLRALFLLAVYTGLRASELRGLRWSNVDLDAGTYRVGRTLHRITKVAERVVGASGLVEGKPKTEDSGKTLPMADQVVELLRQHRDQQSQERDGSPVPWPDEDNVFTTGIGTPLEPSNLNHLWQDILEEAQVSYHTPDGRSRGLHELRRTFATRLRDRGVPLEDVQRLGRWSSPQMLLALYSASDDSRLRHAAGEIADMLDDDLDDA